MFKLKVLTDSMTWYLQAAKWLHKKIYITSALFMLKRKRPQEEDGKAQEQNGVEQEASLAGFWTAYHGQEEEEAAQEVEENPSIAHGFWSKHNATAFKAAFKEYNICITKCECDHCEKGQRLSEYEEDDATEYINGNTLVCAWQESMERIMTGVGIAWSIHAPEGFQLVDERKNEELLCLKLSLPSLIKDIFPIIQAFVYGDLKDTQDDMIGKDTVHFQCFAEPECKSSSEAWGKFFLGAKAWSVTDVIDNPETQRLASLLHLIEFECDYARLAKEDQDEEAEGDDDDDDEHVLVQYNGPIPPRPPEGWHFT
jgi:hypothetical protein